MTRRLYDADHNEVTALDVLDGDDLRDYYADRNERIRQAAARTNRAAVRDPWADELTAVEREMRAMDEEKLA